MYNSYNMREVDRKIQELYTQYKSGQLQLKQPVQGFLPIIGRIAQGLRKGSQDVEKRVVLEQTRHQIENLLRDRPGCYPLARLSYISHISGSGFDYGFDYSLGEDVFAVDYWSYNRWGIFVQKHPKDYTPEIKVVEKTVKPTEEELTEDPEIGPYTTIDRLLHLPEGFRIPVGPLHFKSDSLPISEEELAADKARAIEIAKAAGIKVNKGILEMADRFSGLNRKYPDRYFYWQPIIPDGPTKIAIDFDAIEPYHMGLTLESAPTFSDTLVITDEDL